MSADTARSSRRSLWFIHGAALALISASGCSTTDNAESMVKLYDLIEAFPKATLQSPAPESIQVLTVKVGPEIRPSLFMHPDSEAEFPPVSVAQDAWLAFGIGITDDAWDKAGDGVEFVVLVKDEKGVQTVLFSRYIDPKHSEHDRRWTEARVPLGAFAGQRIQVTLRTSVGPARDTAFDWAAWSTPQIILGHE